MNNLNITKNDCMLWLNNKLINPKTNRTIKENCKTYNEYKNRCLFFGLNLDNINKNIEIIIDKDEITKDDCLLWLKNKLVNPKTNRKIKESAITYNKFQKKAIEFGLIPNNFTNHLNNYKKKSISKSLRMEVWKTYIGMEKGMSKCLCCKSKDIYQMDFHCGHIIAEAKGGETNLSNLKPICKNCNLSMGTINMNEFMKQFN